ncbi:hypothetical protein BKA67DRAFT_529900 [Truncatella angustata]|uniref:Uncharacterized protein n=1 Tax=Truncatella angustata TaxID=152316 RepID=A0A9P9A2U0_9PEZI|nr:uncharacterized protein BKA67DRAFT_529900 [Truncatella angustata]KAH6659762.1 hypothetical protein BKA67DRAFT_529900 [Truncatella angustata]
MSLLQSYRNLSPRTRLGVGVGILAWGFIGLQLSDRAEERFGLKATEEDKAALSHLAPRIVTVEKGKDRHEGQGLSQVTTWTLLNLQISPNCCTRAGARRFSAVVTKVFFNYSDGLA